MQPRHCSIPREKKKETEKKQGGWSCMKPRKRGEVLGLKDPDYLIQISPCGTPGVMSKQDQDSSSQAAVYVYTHRQLGQSVFLPDWPLTGAGRGRLKLVPGSPCHWDLVFFVGEVC